MKYLVTWLLACLLLLIGFLSVDWGRGCDGGLCVLPYLGLLASCALAGVGVLVWLGMSRSAQFRRAFRIFLLLAAGCWLLTKCLG